jgi:hypothetical protein
MSVDDRLSFGEGPLGEQPPEEEPEEEESEGRSSNRAFIFIAVAMGGLILLGILALIAALAFWLPQQKEKQVARVTETVVALTEEAAAWTPTATVEPTVVPSTPTPTTLPTWTPIPTPTATRVVGQTKEPTKPAATPTKSSSNWGGGDTTPSAGLGGFGATAIAVGLAGLVFAARKLRSRR